MEPVAIPTEGEITIMCEGCHETSVVSRDNVQQLCPYCGKCYNPQTTSNIKFHGRLGNLRRLRFPTITNSKKPNVSVTKRYGALTLESSQFSEFVRPDSNTSLPPIDKDAYGKLVTIKSPTDTYSRISSTRRHSSDGLELSSDTNEGKRIKTPTYPELNLDRESYLKLCRTSKETGVFNELQKLLGDMFNSFADICATFKTDRCFDETQAEEPMLAMDLLYTVCDSIPGMPSIIQKTILKSVINALLDENRRLYARDHLRALLILLLNPVFGVQSSFTVLAHLLRSITTLSNADHQVLVNWFALIDETKFAMVVQRILQFITVRQFPPADASLPPMGRSKWWIPTATKVLALLNAANSSRRPAIIDYTEFYNSALDHLDLMTEYYNWQSPSKVDKFSYCQYPFILSIVAKRHILTKDSEHQMVINARRSLVAKVSRHQAPQIDIFFLNIHARRSHLVSDSLNEIARKQKDLKKKIKVSFDGEPGLDMGGLSKEWFQLLIREIFRPDYGMFVYHRHSRCYWFSISQNGNLREYNLIGVLMGLAVYNSIILDLHFPSICYKKLLSPPVVPNIEFMSVGAVKNLTLDDLAEIMPEVSHGLKDLLDYEGDVEEDMCMIFQVSLEEFGSVRTYDLKENGSHIAVTKDNRQEYVDLYLDFILNSAIYEQFRAFYLGFHSVCASNALIMLRSEEVEMLVCGSPNLDLMELKKVAEYDGYRPTDPIVKDFWNIVESFPKELQKRFLLFTTGSDRIPVGGMGEMSFKISRMPNKPDNLPEAHTCFNQLVLPAYKNKEILRQKLIIAISNAEGFGLE